VARTLTGVWLVPVKLTKAAIELTIAASCFIDFVPGN